MTLSKWHWVIRCTKDLHVGLGLGLVYSKPLKLRLGRRGRIRKLQKSRNGKEIWPKLKEMKYNSYGLVLPKKARWRAWLCKTHWRLSETQLSVASEGHIGIMYTYRFLGQDIALQLARRWVHMSNATGWITETTWYIIIWLLFNTQ